MDEDEAAAVSRDSERKLAGSAEGFADRPMPPSRGNQQQKAAAAGPQELAAQGTSPACCFVPLVDLVVTDSTAERSLQCPTLMQQGRKSVQVPLTAQGIPHLVGQVPHRSEHVHAVGGRSRLALRIRLASRVWPV